MRYISPLDELSWDDWYGDAQQAFATAAAKTLQVLAIEGADSPRLLRAIEGGKVAYDRLVAATLAYTAFREAVAHQGTAVN